MNHFAALHRPFPSQSCPASDPVILAHTQAEPGQTQNKRPIF